MLGYMVAAQLSTSFPISREAFDSLALAVVSSVSRQQRDKALLCLLSMYASLSSPARKLSEEDPMSPNSCRHWVISTTS